ncbi:MAG: multidrug ABC transporter ATP-binding protein [Actinobacteria bacterium HGW-Actinobacteria-2]|nr:MAG: multidrug ABC transporter ATP-binding protein [Actinobacteria bacterium HGW-Actinobacteria-2]
MNELEPAIRVRGLTKTFGAFTAVDGIDVTVTRGQIFGFLGPNGSGKTTTIRMLTGTLRPQSGAAEVLGVDVVRHPERVQQRIGYMSQKFSLFEDMTVDENLKFYAGVYEVPAEEFAERRAYVLKMADLEGRENELTRNLSVGWRQRLALGAATIHTPELLFLDEPTSGVDPVARRQFWDLLYDLAGRGVTLFVTTHYMDEAAHCNQLAFIYRGKIIAEGSPAELRRAFTQRVFDITVSSSDLALDYLVSADGIDEAYLSGASLHAAVGVDSQITGDDLRRRLVTAGFADAEVDDVEPTIEDVFVNLVSQNR